VTDDDDKMNSSYFDTYIFPPLFLIEIYYPSADEILQYGFVLKQGLQDKSLITAVTLRLFRDKLIASRLR
jgi:hypothetical protein